MQFLRIFSNKNLIAIFVKEKRQRKFCLQMIKKNFHNSVLLLILLACSCKTVNDDPIPHEKELTEEQRYFMNIAFGAELGAASPVIRKWVNDVNIYMACTEHAVLNDEANLVIAELNQLIESISIRRVNTREESNLVLYCGDAETFVRDYEPATKQAIKNNLGLFWVHWNTRDEIVRANVFIDTQHSHGEKCLRHLLREELTQSLGLMQDSYDYMDSIFQQRWTCINSYSAADAKVIQLLYHPLVKAGMSKKDLLGIIKKL
jgi:hypothetical protein